MSDHEDVPQHTDRLLHGFHQEYHLVSANAIANRAVEVIDSSDLKMGRGATDAATTCRYDYTRADLHVTHAPCLFWNS